MDSEHLLEDILLTDEEKGDVYKRMGCGCPTCEEMAKAQVRKVVKWLVEAAEWLKESTDS